jgi:hypothetical protein
MCGCSTIEHLHILPSLHVTFGANIFWAAGLAMVHQHLPWHYPGHYVILTSPHQTTLSGPLSRGKWLCTAITAMTSCAELCDGLSTLLCHKCVGACQAEHYNTSGHAWYMTVHIQIHLMYGNSDQMIKVQWHEVALQWLPGHPVEESIKKYAGNTLLFTTLFWLWCIHGTWVADGTFQTSI